MIPTRSSKPTAYLPRFSLLWLPANALNPMTSVLILHFPSLTSIQCAVIPWNVALVVSADHPSKVTDTLPGAFCSNAVSTIQSMNRRTSYSYLLFQWVYMFDKPIVEMDFDVIGTWKVRSCRFRPHRNEGVSIGDIISKSERLEVCCQLLHCQMQTNNRLYC